MGVLRAGLCPGLTEEIVQLLRGRRIKTVADLAAANLEEIAQKCGLSYKVSSRCACSISSLDKLLDAGLYTGEVTEIVGGPAANVAHSLQQNVLYVDSNGGMTASRLLQLLQARTQDEEKQAGALQRIQVVHTFDIFQMLDMLQDLRGAMAQQVTTSSGTVKVVIVDSVTAVVAPLLGGQQREGLALMMQLARELKILARDLGVAVMPTGLQEVIDIGTLGSEEQSPELSAKQT
ncbi:hypothetical protein A6R68_07010 [Neotoma lepida]|uniref:RecA family profile 1 domain-containing protein n=1 Tax=Neotoma lepida TaxID=56216 RepID=A0A1A6GGN1_NEOLE|nr:hypothetical protein A6R68_07010 [Neotoma lepida]